jgi:hypothetical protein
MYYTFRKNERLGCIDVIERERRKTGKYSWEGSYRTIMRLHKVNGHYVVIIPGGTQVGIMPNGTPVSGGFTVGDKPIDVIKAGNKKEAIKRVKSKLENKVYGL